LLVLVEKKEREGEKGHANPCRQISITEGEEKGGKKTKRHLLRTRRKEGRTLKKRGRRIYLIPFRGKERKSERTSFLSPLKKRSLRGERRILLYLKKKRGAQKGGFIIYLPLPGKGGNRYEYLLSKKTSHSLKGENYCLFSSFFFRSFSEGR